MIYCCWRMSHFLLELCHCNIGWTGIWFIRPLYCPQNQFGDWSMHAVLMRLYFWSTRWNVCISNSDSLNKGLILLWTELLDMKATYFFMSELLFKICFVISVKSWQWSIKNMSPHTYPHINSQCSKLVSKYIGIFSCAFNFIFSCLVAFKFICPAGSNACLKNDRVNFREANRELLQNPTC